MNAMPNRMRYIKVMENSMMKNVVKRMLQELKGKQARD